jgi:shikimate kinase
MKGIAGKNLVLIGFMGTGKTEVGRLLADILNRRHVDLDSLIAERAGMTITEIFSARGEAGFRAMESEAVREMSAQRGLVISTGGGAVMSGENVSCLRESGLVVWLEAGLDSLRERLKDDTTRPMLANKGDMAALYQRRLPLYSDAAHIRVDTTGKQPLAVAEEIMLRIGKEVEKKSV